MLLCARACPCHHQPSFHFTEQVYMPCERIIARRILNMFYTIKNFQSHSTCKRDTCPYEETKALWCLVAFASNGTRRFQRVDPDPTPSMLPPAGSACHAHGRSHSTVPALRPRARTDKLLGHLSLALFVWPPLMPASSGSCFALGELLLRANKILNPHLHPKYICATNLMLSPNLYEKCMVALTLAFVTSMHCHCPLVHVDRAASEPVLI